jgi:hypothetical protein
MGVSACLNTDYVTPAHAVDVTRELLPFIFVYSVTDVGIGAFDCDFACFGWQYRGCLLLELDIELYVFISRIIERYKYTDLDPILKLYFPRGVYADILECFSGSIIGSLATAL